jgi:endonuclease/exonuclease/phosphatase family metal-dependent hydrolase
MDNKAQVISEEDLDIGDCVATTSNDALEIVTWNLRNFPLEGEFTIEQVADMLLLQDADLIALQELGSEEACRYLLSLMPGWKSAVFYRDGLNLGFLYKEREVALLAQPGEIFTDEHYAFPRPPAIIEIVHTSGIEVRIINLHLKCCGGAENELRRREASHLLKEYIDSAYPSTPVVVLGDFNDEIAGIPDEENVFLNFVNDPVNFRFADLDIALSGRSEWSYPSYPSHIDHILVTDELFSLVDSVGVLTYDACDGRYFRYISDHRPVLLRLSY